MVDENSRNFLKDEILNGAKHSEDLNRGKVKSSDTDRERLL